MKSLSVSNDTLLIFVGHSSDADDEAQAVCSLERRIQREVDARIEVMAGAHRFSKVKVWEWNAEAKVHIGGQRRIIHPYLQRANVAVFIFKERVGSVTWEELNECRNQYSIPLLAAFAGTPPSTDRMLDIETVTNWSDLLTKKCSLSSDWIDTESRSVLPVSEYKNVDHLKEIVLDHIIRILGDLLRMTGAPEVAQESPRSLDVTTYEELRLAYETTATSRRPCHGATSRDLDWELIRRFAQGQEQVDNAEVVLENLGLFSPLSALQKSLHNSAVLCFAKCPERFIPQARSCFVMGNTRDAQFTRIDVTGPLSRQVTELETLVAEHLGKVSTFGEGALRQDDLEIPRSLIRELISNAIAHRDYTSHGSVRVSLTDDVLEVSNPGWFPGNATWDWMLGRQFTSNPVDPAIAWYLTRLLALEGIGRGFNLFRDYIAKNGKKALECERLANPATVTIRVKRPKSKVTPRIDSYAGRNFRTGISSFVETFLSKFLQRKSEIVCPYCITNISLGEDERNCLYCKRSIPSSYKENYKQARTALVPIVGWSGMGKTVLLASCLHMLQRLGEIWDDYYILHETQDTLTQHRMLMSHLSRSEWPTATSPTSTTPLIISLHKMVRWGNMGLVLHDLAGEVFSTLEISEDKFHLLESADTSLVVYSIKDLEDLHERSMDELLMSYRSATLRVEQGKRRRKVMIIALTKADLLDDLPEELQTYLKDDPFIAGNVRQLKALGSLGGMAKYINGMTRVSEVITQWIARKSDGIRFLNLARSMNLEVRFTICSALGPEAFNNPQIAAFQPCRVLDPFFWLFETIKDQ
jgi:hypothetical protein